MVKVVEIISDTNIGGAGVLLTNRLKHSDRKKIDTSVILPKNSLLVPIIKKMDIDCIELDGCCDRSFDVSSILKTKKIIERLHPDIVNTHGCLSGRVAAYLAHVPVKIYTRHCTYPVNRFRRSPAVKLVMCCVTHVLSDRVIAVANAAKGDLIEMGVDAEMISVIINGSDPVERMSAEKRKKIRSEMNISDDAKVVSIFARLEDCKDHITFLRAAVLLLRSNPKYVFLIVGSGSREQVLKNMVKTLGISDNVIFTGFVDDITAYMNITDINVNCSVGTETSSLALSEGMSLSIPPVVSDYGGNPYMVQNGKNGLMFRCGDYTGLAEAIISLDDPELYADLSKKAGERFRSELNAKRMTVLTESLYLKLFKRKTSNSSVRHQTF